MENAQKLYLLICKDLGKESLTDEEIHGIVLSLQRRLGQAGDTVEFRVREFINVDANFR